MAMYFGVLGEVYVISWYSKYLYEIHCNFVYIWTYFRFHCHSFWKWLTSSSKLVCMLLYSTSKRKWKALGYPGNISRPHLFYERFRYCQLLRDRWRSLPIRSCLLLVIVSTSNIILSTINQCLSKFPNMHHWTKGWATCRRTNANRSLHKTKNDVSRWLKAE